MAEPLASGGSVFNLRGGNRKTAIPDLKLKMNCINHLGPKCSFPIMKDSIG